MAWKVLAELVRERIAQQIRIAALTLVLTAWALLAFGIVLSLWSHESNPHVGTYEPHASMACFDIERHQSYTSLRLHVGSSPTEAYTLLVRTDAIGQCQQDTLEGVVFAISSARALGSSSLQCDNSTELCADVILASRSPSSFSKQERMVAPIRLGTPHLLGYESQSLGLDGEVHLCKGSRLVVSASRACLSAVTTQWTPPSAKLHNVRSLDLYAEDSSVGRSNWLTTSNLTICGAVSDKPVQVTPSSVRVDNKWSSVVFDSEATKDINGAFVQVMRHGLFCQQYGTAQSLRITKALRTACETLGLASLDRAASLLCDGTPIFEYGAIASSDYVLEFQNSVAVSGSGQSSESSELSGWRQPLGQLKWWSDESLDGLALRSLTGSTRQDEQAAFDTSIYRLAVMVLAALIMWTRKEDRTHQSDSVLLSCIDMLYHHVESMEELRSLLEREQTDRPKRRDDNGADGDIQDGRDKEGVQADREDDFLYAHVDTPLLSRFLGLLAIFARLVVATVMQRRLRADTLGALVTMEQVAASCSLVHWSQLHMLRLFHVARSDRRPMLGGSSAVIDVACATMVTFAETPLYSSDNSFDDIARLLTAMLITMACVTRTIFSASCCAAGVLPSLQDKRKVQHSVESGFSLLYWWLQGMQTVYILQQLFVMPFSTALAHRSVQDPSFVSLCIFVALVAVGACPRLTTNAESIVRHSKAHRA